MYRTMARFAIRGVRIAEFGGLAVNAFLKPLDFLLVTGFTVRESGFCGFDDVRITVAGLAGVLAQRGVNAIWNIVSFVRVAGGALYLLNFGGMGKFLEIRVAIAAAENPMHALRVFRRINRKILTLF